MKSRICFILLASFVLACPAVAQSIDHRGARLLVKQGNKAFRDGKRNDATTLFQKAVKADSTNARALYNLATSMMPTDWQNVNRTPEWATMQAGRRDTMISSLTDLYKVAAANEENTNRRSMAFFNAGVLNQGAYDGEGGQGSQNLQTAIEMYKEALRYNPADEEARYNIVLCLRQMKNGDGGGQGDSQNPEGDQQQEQQEQQQQQQEEQQQQQKQQEQPQMSQENAEQLLNAALQNEQQTQQRVEQQQQQQQPGRRQLNEKNW